LSAEEQAVLAARARSARGPYRDRLRAAIVLAAAAGQDNAAIARQQGVCADTVRIRSLQRYRTHGINVLYIRLVRFSFLILIARFVTLVL
jgi:hypothetical protein